MVVVAVNLESSLIAERNHYILLVPNTVSVWSKLPREAFQEIDLH